MRRRKIHSITREQLSLPGLVGEYAGLVGEYAIITGEEDCELVRSVRTNPTGLTRTRRAVSLIEENQMIRIHLQGGYEWASAIPEK